MSLILRYLLCFYRFLDFYFFDHLHLDIRYSFFFVFLLNLLNLSEEIVLLTRL